MSFLQHNSDASDAQPHRGRQISNQNQNGGASMKEIFAWDANAAKDSNGRNGAPVPQQRPVTLKPQEQQPQLAVGSGRRGAGASNRTTYNFMTGE